jgi:hypothetical protein
MAYNPRNVKKVGKDATPPVIAKTGGAPGIIVSPLQMIEAEAKRDLAYKKTPLKPITTNETECGVKREYYMEWWKIGTDHKEIETSWFHSGHIKNFLTQFLAGNKRTVIFLERVEDKKILRDVRGTL